MPPLWLDYQHPVPGHQRPGWLLLLAGLLVTAGLIGYYVHLSNTLEQQEQRVATLRRQAQRLQAVPVSAEASPIVETTLHSARRWEGLFDSLEKAADENVTLTSLDPGTKEVSISGEAKDLASVAAYVQRLQLASALARARLAEYDVVKDRPRHPIHFVVVADWRESAR